MTNYHPKTDGLLVMPTMLMLLGAFLLPATVHAAPILTYTAWSSDQTSLFTQVAGNTSWNGNDLIARYRQEYGSAA